MKTHRLVFREVDRDKFQALCDGSKPIETRAATEKYRGIKAGDKLVVVCGVDTVEKTVKEVRHFESIDTMLGNVPMQAVCPGAGSIEDVYKMYYSFPGYKDKIAQHGLMAFWL